MGRYTERWSEANAILTQINPATYNSQQVSSWVSVKNYHRFVVILDVGAIPNDTLINAQIEQATDTLGAGQKILATMTALGTADDNGKVIFDLQTEQLDVSGGYDCINIKVTPQGTGAIFSALIIGHQPRHKPVPVTAWEQIVSTVV